MAVRALAHEAATPEDIAAMRAQLRAALEAGAAGFSTGRTDNHRTSRGLETPASDAGAAELVGLGHVYGNLMVGVRPDNEKLRDRQRRILVEASGCSHDEAETALAATGRDARAALVVLLTGADPGAALAAVRDSSGDVRAAVRLLL